MLTAMERVARFEIKRTNWILGTDFAIVPSWFKFPFFSWNGVKERVTSLRSWMAIAYVFIAFGWSIFAFVIVVLGGAGLGLILIAAGIITLSQFNQSFQFVDKTDGLSGNIQFFGSMFKVDLRGTDGSAILAYDVDSWWIALIGLALTFLALWIIPRNARAMAKMVEGLLSGSFYPNFESRIKNIVDKRKSSVESVEAAIADEVARPELSQLSQREREILSLMAQGKSNSGIAKSLYITEGSVEKHISSILSKLGIAMESENHRRVLAVLKYLGIEE
jgi:DNA-binding CsgD family transcriptional regulator/type IV secretory pathway TrbD component